MGDGEHDGEGEVLLEPERLVEKRKTYQIAGGISMELGSLYLSRRKYTTETIYRGRSVAGPFV